MASKKSIVRNILWNWSGQLVAVALGFFIAPFLVHHLGQKNYGLWVVIGSLTGYFGLFDLGVRTSVGRYLAYYRTKKDPEAVNATLNTAGAYLLGAGLVALAGTLAFQLFFFDIFDVPAEEVEAARWALALVGVNLALTLPLTLFDATLWALQRFDMMNWAEMATAVIQSGLTVWLIGTGHGLVALALITLAATVIRGLAMMAFSFREERGLRLGWRFVRRDTAWTLLSYSVWRVLMAVSTIGITRINPLVIGAWLGVILVTPYALAARLLGFVTQVMEAVRKVLTPAATELHAEERPAWQRAFMVQGGKYAATLGLFFLSGVYFLGEPFFALWIGPRLADAGWLLFLLVAGELLPLYQSATSAMLLGMARHRVLAYLGLIEIGLSLSLAALFIEPYGLVGVCTAQAVAAAVCRGVIQIVYACRLVGIPVLPYLARSLGPAVLVAAVPATLLGLAVEWHQPRNWPEMFLYGGGYAAVYLVSSLFLVGLGPVRAGLAGRFGRRRGVVAENEEAKLNSAEEVMLALPNPPGRESVSSVLTPGKER
jgi:O-antigen/teichoic acid export membrane protein